MPSFSQLVDQILDESTLSVNHGSVARCLNDIQAICLPHDHFTNIESVGYKYNVSVASESKGYIVFNLPSNFLSLATIHGDQKTRLKLVKSANEFANSTNTVTLQGGKLYIKSENTRQGFYMTYYRTPKVFTYRPPNLRLISVVDQVVKYRPQIGNEFTEIDLNDPDQLRAYNNNVNFLLLNYPGLLSLGVNSKLASQFGDLSIGARLFTTFESEKDTMLKQIEQSHLNNTIE